MKITDTAGKVPTVSQPSIRVLNCLHCKLNTNKQNTQDTERKKMRESDKVTKWNRDREMVRYLNEMIYLCICCQISRFHETFYYFLIFSWGSLNCRHSNGMDILKLFRLVIVNGMLMDPKDKIFIHKYAIIIGLGWVIIQIH